MPDRPADPIVFGPLPDHDPAPIPPRPAPLPTPRRRPRLRDLLTARRADHRR